MRWGAYLLVAAAFAVACMFLSQWQFDRNEERSSQIALVEKNYDAEPLALEDVLDDGALIDEFEWHPVELHGEYLTDEQVLVRNRPHGGTSAFEVLVPFRDDSGQVFLVDRGWVPPGEGDGPDAVGAAPSGETTVVVRMRPGESLPASGRGAPEGQVPTIHLPTIAERVNPELITGAYGQLVSEDPAGEALGGFTSPTDDPGPHLSYAIQWILFGIMGFAFIGYVIRIEIVKAREDAGEIAPREPRRRADRDADDEDALLDAAH